MAIRKRVAQVARTIGTLARGAAKVDIGIARTALGGSPGIDKKGNFYESGASKMTASGFRDIKTASASAQAGGAALAGAFKKLKARKMGM